MARLKFRIRLRLFFGKIKTRYDRGSRQGLFRVSALIRKESRQSIRMRRQASSPGNPPSAHTRGGLREINFDVRQSESIIGPRKFPRSNFFNRPVPNIHEKGGTVVAAGLRGAYTARYPERSFMWRAVRTLKRRGKIGREFNITMQRSW